MANFYNSSSWLCPIRVEIANPKYSLNANLWLTFEMSLTFSLFLIFGIPYDYRFELIHDALLQ